ncbi:MAG: hypothetical protein AAF719_13560 [Pseudomonadota bacterium]
MWAGAKAAFVGAASLAAMQANAEITTSGPLTQVDPWGVGWLGGADGALPSTLWDGASAIRLEDLMAQIDVSALSPASADLLRRTLLSSGRGPTGADAALILGRLSLLHALGEGEKAIDLKLRFTGKDWASDGLAERVDRDLAAGRLSEACAEADAFNEEDAFWLKLRALCFAAAGELAAAELTLEVARSSGIEDAWIRAALKSVDAPNDPKPVADYSSGLHAEASIFADLEPADNSMDFVAPDIAAMIATRADIGEDLRVSAAFNAALAGKLPAKTARDILIRPTPALEEDAPALTRTALEQATDLFEDPLLDVEAKAAGLAGVLDVEGQSFAAFRLASTLLTSELVQIAPSPETTPYAEVFARAALVSGDLDRARAWRGAMDPPPPPEPEPVELIDISLETDDQGAIDLLPTATDEMLLDEVEPQAAPEPAFVFPEWTKARIDALLVIAGAEIGDAAAKDAALRLTAHMDGETEAETARVLHIYSALGKAMPSEAREILARADSDVGRAIGYGDVAAIQSAAAAGVLGEAALASLVAMGGDPAAAEAGGLGMVLSILASAGFEDDARALAMEALSPQFGL